MLRPHISHLFVTSVLMATALSASGAQLVQQGSKLVGSGGVGTPEQGVAVSMSADGNTLLIGGEHDNGDIGAAWVFTRANGVWTQQGNKLVGTGNVGASLQGTSVALSADGNTAILGAVGDSGNNGAAWVFTRSSGVWTQQGNKLVGTGNTGNAGQGSSVTLSADGSTALVGGQADNANVGAVWVFILSSGVWSQQGAKLVGTGFVGAPGEGHAVSLSGDGNTAVITGPFDNGNNGAFWIFTRSAGVWTQQGSKMLSVTNIGAALQGFSATLSSDAQTLLIGGFGDNGNIGAAWVFTNSAGVWSEQAKLIGTGNVGGSKQGLSSSLSRDGNSAFVGGGSDNGNTGAGWLFTRSAGVWTQQGSKFVGTGFVGASGMERTAISSDGSTVALGGFNDNGNQGAVWVFSTPPVSFSSAGSATPATAGVGQTVTFSATATGTGTVTYSWNFGDGSALAMGATVTHAYAAPGTFTAAVTATDTANTTSSSTVSVTVNAPVVGSGTDSDGDGFSDAFEMAVGTDAGSAASTPTGAIATPGASQPLTISKASIKLNFAKTGSDSITLSGTVAVPAGFGASGAKTYYLAGGVSKTLMLTAKGSGLSGKDSVKVALKSKKGIISATPAAKYTISFKNGSFAATLAAAGLTNADAKGAPVSVPFTFIFNNVIYQKTQSMSYTAKKGKAGSAK